MPSLDILALLVERVFKFSFHFIRYLLRNSVFHIKDLQFAIT
jgi:hypothetical protein